MEQDADVSHAASLLDISHDLHTTPTVTNLSVAFYMLAMSFFPLWCNLQSYSFSRASTKTNFRVLIRRRIRSTDDLHCIIRTLPYLDHISRRLYEYSNAGHISIT